MTRTSILHIVTIVALALLPALPAFAQVSLGTSASSTNPQRSGDATTGFFSATTDAVSISSGGVEIMRVNGTGVGIGTTSPQGQLDVISTANTLPRDISSYQFGANSGSALIDFYKARGSVGSPAAVTNDDYVGSANIDPYDGSNYLNVAGLGGRVNGTVSTGSVPLDLYFYTTGGVNDVDPYTNGHVRMVISSGGNVGIGTSSPSNLLHVYSSGSNVDLVQIESDNTFGSPNQLQIMGKTTNSDGVLIGYNTSSNYASIQSWQNSAAGTLALQPNGGSVGVATVSPSYTLQVNGSVAGSSAYVNTSDIRLKKDVEPIPYGLDALMKLHPIGFNWKEQDQDWKKQHQIGLSAQEVEDVIPEVVSTAHDPAQTKGIAYGSLVPVLIKAIQEEQAEIEQLKKLNARVDRGSRDNAGSSVH